MYPTTFQRPGYPYLGKDIANLPTGGQQVVWQSYKETFEVRNHGDIPQGEPPSPNDAIICEHCHHEHSGAFVRFSVFPPSSLADLVIYCSRPGGEHGHASWLVLLCLKFSNISQKRLLSMPRLPRFNDSHNCLYLGLLLVSSLLHRTISQLRSNTPPTVV